MVTKEQIIVEWLEKNVGRRYSSSTYYANGKDWELYTVRSPTPRGAACRYIITLKNPEYVTLASLYFSEFSDISIQDYNYNIF